MRVAGFFFSLLVPMALVAGCSAKEDPPSGGSLSIDFPSPQLAVVTQSMTVAIFDATGKTNFCEGLINDRIVQHVWTQPVIATSDTFSPCQLLNNDVKLPAVSYGVRAIAVAGQSSKGNKGDLVVGCTVVQTGEGDYQVPISLTPVNTNANDPNGAQAAVKQTKCATLGDFCSAPPKCQ